MNLQMNKPFAFAITAICLTTGFLGTLCARKKINVKGSYKNASLSINGKEETVEKKDVKPEQNAKMISEKNGKSEVKEIALSK